MDATLKMPQTVNYTVLRRDPNRIMDMLDAGPVMIVKRSMPEAVLVSAAQWEQIMSKVK